MPIPLDSTEVDANVLMQQFGQFLVRAMQYAQKDTNVLRAQQGSPLAPGTSFGPPADMEDSVASTAMPERMAGPIATAPRQAPQAGLPQQPPSPVLKDETWAEHYKVPSRTREEMYALRERVVQESARRQRAMAPNDSDILAGPNPFTEQPPAPVTQPIQVPQPPRPAMKEPAPPPPPVQAPQPQTIIRTPPVPASGDEWGNWQNTQIDTTKTTGSDNTQPDSTKIGTDLRNQMDRLGGDMHRLFDGITKSIVKINERLEQIEAGFESRECI
jgi:hypothetical protein